MTLTTESLRAWLGNPNYLAFAYALEEGEIPKPYRHTPDAYRVLFGGDLLDDLSRHPNRKVTAGGYTSTAAGRFQALWGTWSDFCRDISEDPETLPFTAEWQDLFGVWCCNRRHALADIAAGRIHEAVKKCGAEWASLPGSPYGQPTITMDQFLAAYTAAGGVIDNAELLSPVQPAAEPVAPVSSPEKPMPFPLALIAALGPVISELIPQVAKAFDRKAETPARTQAAAAIVETITKATGSVNVQEAVEKMQADPAIRKAAADAVLTNQTVAGLLEIGGGVEAARKAATDPAAPPFWRQGAFVVAIILTPLIYMTVYRVLWSPDYSEQLRTVVVTAILSGLLGALTGYFFGSMYSSNNVAKRSTDEVKA